MFSGYNGMKLGINYRKARKIKKKKMWRLNNMLMYKPWTKNKFKNT